MADPRRRTLGVLLGALALLAGCGGIPDSGAVHVGRLLPGGGGGGIEDDRSILPPVAIPGMSPLDVVHGFLRAMVNQDGNYEVARSYLTPRAASVWTAAGPITTYDDGAVRVASGPSRPTGRSITISAPRVGTIDARGDFTVRRGNVRATFTLVRADGQWRIDKLPTGPLLSATDAARSFRFADVYYANRAGTTLVPEQILLRPVPQVVTDLVRALLDGPGRWLAPAVRTGFPPGTTLIGNVPIDLSSGLAEVNLSGSVRKATPAQLRVLSAQLLWTLRQTSEITAVRLLADGSPLAVPGVPANQPRTSWSSFDPAAPPAVTTAFYDAGGSWTGIDREVHGLAAADGLDALAMSDDGHYYAGLTRQGRGAALYVGAVGSPPTRRLRADTLTAPTFDPGGTAYTVASRGSRRWVAAVSAGGATHHVPVRGRLLRQPVQQLRLSRDGARVAAVVGRPGHGRLLVGRLASVRGVLRLDGFQQVLAGVDDVRGIAWDGADQVVVTAAAASGGRELLDVDANGYSTLTISTVGLGGQPTDVAAAPGHPLAVTAGHAVWLDDPVSGWRRVGAGRNPAYAG